MNKHCTNNNPVSCETSRTSLLNASPLKRCFSSTLLAVLIGFSFSTTSFAQELPQNEQSTIATDFLLPLALSSKNQSLDGKKKTSIFIDNVVIRQGSLEILADRVEADATAGKGKEIITATGSPAVYSQRLEDGTLVSARANEIKYVVELQTISLKGNADINQNDIKVSGDSIAFDMDKEQIMASGDANSDTGVTTILSPGAFVTNGKSDEDKP